MNGGGVLEKRETAGANVSNNLKKAVCCAAALCLVTRGRTAGDHLRARISATEAV